MSSRRAKAGVNQRYTPPPVSRRSRSRNVEVTSFLDQDEEEAGASSPIEVDRNIKAAFFPRRTASPLKPDSERVDLPAKDEAASADKSAEAADPYGLSNNEAMVWDESITLREVGRHISSQEFVSNAEIFQATPFVTMDVQSVGVTDLLSGSMNTDDIQKTLVGMGTMINRLIYENQNLVQEIGQLKSLGSASRFDSLVFKKSNITHTYAYSGGEGIPTCVVNDYLEMFDQSCNRRNDTAINTLRRFIKFLLEHIIPPRLHGKFTVRERSGYERLDELPPELTDIIKNVCFESVNLYDPRNEEERCRQTELDESITRIMKFALQELRRTPRKAKVPVAKSK